MAKPDTTHLKLYTEQTPKVARPPIEAVGSLPSVLRAFEKLTGRSLRYVSESLAEDSGDETCFEIGLCEGENSGRLVLAPAGQKLTDSHSSKETKETRSAKAGSNASTKKSKLVKDDATVLASAIAGLLTELMQTRYTLWQREADLAAGVPLVPHEAEEENLAERLQASLKGCVDAINCQAAALYMLDEATTELKMRSCWGLPFDRLTAPARPLQGELADLEALLGHAVVLENTALMPGWRSPEDFASAVCVPISSPTTLLGTLWIFGDEPREFTDQEVNIVEIVAGKVASDLQREMLLKEGVESASLKKEWAVAERTQRNQLPSVSPMLDSWQVSGWSAQSQGLGGAFHDWFCLPNGLLAANMGAAVGSGLQGALTSATIKSAFRSHGQYRRQAEEVIQAANMTLWTGSAGDQLASAFYGLAEISSGIVNCSWAGKPSVVLLREDSWFSQTKEMAMLGESPDVNYEQLGLELSPGETLLVFSDGFRSAVDQFGNALGEEGLAKILAHNSQLTADQMIAMARECLRLHSVQPDLRDLSILAIKRTRK